VVRPILEDRSGSRISRCNRSRSFVDTRGSLALPAALHDGCPLPGPSSRDDVAAPSPARRQMRTDPPDLDSTSEYSSNALVVRPSLVGFVRAARPIGPGGAPFAPPSTSRGASTPALRIRRASVSRSHPRNRVPSSWFRTTSTVSAAPCSRACCIPLPILGFAAFPAGAARPPTEVDCRSELRVSRDVNPTLRRNDSNDGRTASPQPLSVLEPAVPDRVVADVLREPPPWGSSPSRSFSAAGLPGPPLTTPSPPEDGRRNGASVRTRLPAQCGRRARAPPCGRERGDAAPDGPAPGGLADHPRVVGVPCVDDGRSHRSDASDRDLASEVGPIRTESLRRFVRAGELVPATAAEALGGSARLGCPSRAGRCR